jgi:hypothetical protein
LIAISGLRVSQQQSPCGSGDANDDQTVNQFDVDILVRGIFGLIVAR